MISERAKKLIPQARIVSFTTWKSRYSEQTIKIFQQADDEGRYLTDEELEGLKISASETDSSLEIAKLLRDKSVIIVQKAREQVLAAYPNISEPEGDLYPPERAEACWRDFWHFLRCVTYGVAGKSLEFTSPSGLENMRLLYRELRVPLPAMVCGLENLKISSLELLTTEEQKLISPYFDHLIEQLKRF